MKVPILLRAVVLIVLWTSFLRAQQIDSVLSGENRTPSTLADELTDPGERADFVALYNEDTAAHTVEKAKKFLNAYPQSALLAPAYDRAARASFAVEDYAAGLEYANHSLALLPENPLLRVSVADVEARQGMTAKAIPTARQAIDDLNRFARPASIAAADWPALKRNLEATAYFALGRSLLLEALDDAKEEKRGLLLKESETSLSQAQQLRSGDLEIRFLRGLARLSSQQMQQAAIDFAAVSQGEGELAAKALDNLRAVYKVIYPRQQIDFRLFRRQMESYEERSSPASVFPGNKTVKRLSDYAGSESCRGCHESIYQSWSQSGMAKMLRPYRPENVVGDFAKDNQFFLGDEVRWRGEQPEFIPGENRSLFARMELKDGRHYFLIRQQDGQWHSYPVDYTIGSKWQQAYATRLANGQIHVFPLQYNLLFKRWINFWQVIDAASSGRANLRAWEKFSDSTSYQANCAACHTSQLRNLRGGGFAVANLEFREPGVDCEMCHGPSLDHVVEEKILGSEPMAKDPTAPPVQFGKISSRDFIRICAQCHMQSALRNPGPAGELNYSRTDNYAVEHLSIPFAEFSRKGFYKDGRFRQTTFIVEALERSQCFQTGQLTCATCHDPHGPRSSSNLASVKFPDQPNRMCTVCHRELADNSRLEKHTHHAPDSEGSDCVSCHMPRIMEALLFRARTHQIDDMPNAEATLRFGAQESPNACLFCHRAKDAKWLQVTLAGWKATP